ncbi:ATP-binding protein [Mucilaginibacter sp. AW1-3]
MHHKIPRIDNNIRLIFLYFICCAFLSLLFSCNRQQNNDSSSANDFTKEIDKARDLYNNNPDKGIHYLDSLAAKHRDIGTANQFEAYEMHCAYFYHAHVNYDKAMLYADSMLNLIQNSGNLKAYTKQLGIAYFSKGDVYFAVNHFPEAYHYYYLGKVTGKDNFNNCTLSDYSYRMGMIMYKQAHFNIAANYFKESFAEGANCTMNFVTFYRNQELLDNTAISYSKSGLTDSARIYYEKTLAYINRESANYNSRAYLIDVARAVVYGNQAQLYTAKGDFARAEDLLKKSIAINLRKGNDNRDAQLSELKLANIYTKKNHPELFKLLTDIRAQLDSVKNPDAEVEWNHLMASYYEKHNELKKALSYFDKYDFLKDSLSKTTQKLKESDVNQQFKDFENQSTINNLKTDNQLKQNYLTVALIYSVMALVIILLIFLNWRRSKANVKTLSQLNAQILQQKDTLEQAFYELEVTDKEKDRILRAVAHDLRNPIGGIASLTALMLMEDLDSEQKQLLELIQNTTNNSLELINEILEATGTPSANTIKKQMVDINTLLSNSIELLRFKAAEKNQKIMLEMLESPEELYISREKIWRVISNLISNAIKFSPQGSDIYVKVINEGKHIRISVSDHGIGIPDNIKGQVFNMFTQAKRVGTAGEPSFGLGLSISKQIIESHGGDIWFESAPGDGTTFYIRLKKQA